MKKDYKIKKEKKQKSEHKDNKALRILKTFGLPLLSLFIVIYAFLYLSNTHSTNRLFLSFINKYQIGDLVNENIYAPTSLTFIDESKTNIRRSEALKASLPIYTVSLRDTSSDINTVNEIFDALSSKNRENIAFALSKHTLDVDTRILETILAFDEKDANTFYSLGKTVALEVINRGLFDESDLNRSKENGYDYIVLLNDIDGKENKTVVKIADCLNEHTLETAVYNILKDRNSDNLVLIHSISLLVPSLIKTNAHYDRALTALERQRVSDSVEPSMVTLQKGDILVSKDSIVTPHTISLLKDISESSSPYNFTQKGVILVFFVALFVGFFILFSFILKADRRRVLFTNTIFVSLALFVALTSGLYPLLSGIFNDISYNLFVASFIVPLLIFSITENKMLGFATVLFSTSVLALLPFSALASTFRYFFVSFLSVEFLYYTNNRVERLVNYALVFLLDVLITVITLTMEGFDFASILSSTVTHAVVFVVGVSVASAFSIILETAFNLPTQYRLLELIARKTPLLEKFEQVCPGSYEHSSAVSKLATEASDELSLNTSLVKLASMYHDVGKMEHPLYFIENQQDENKHDSISSELSVSTIRSHVAYGAKLAKSARLPQEVIDIISEHHGNDTINYFYYEAQRAREEQGGQKEDVNEKDFAYDALPPQTKEAAVVMLSDISEAAVRSTRQAYQKRGEAITEDVIRNVIHRLFMSKVENNQLSESTLTIGELQKVENLFVEKLLSSNHARIEYKKPEDDEKKEDGSDKS